MNWAYDYVSWLLTASWYASPGRNAPTQEISKINNLIKTGKIASPPSMEEVVRIKNSLRKTPPRVPPDTTKKGVLGELEARFNRVA